VERNCSEENYRFSHPHLDLPQLCRSLEYEVFSGKKDGYFECWSAEEREQKIKWLQRAAERMHPASVVMLGTEYGMAEITAVKEELALVLPSPPGGLRLERL
jgi:hypothetical protein